MQEYTKDIAAGVVMSKRGKTIPADHVEMVGAALTLRREGFEAVADRHCISVWDDLSQTEIELVPHEDRLIAFRNGHPFRSVRWRPTELAEAALAILEQ